MFDSNFDDLDLGSRRKPTEWVAFAPVPEPRKKKIRPKGKVPKESNGRVLTPGNKPSGSSSKFDSYGNEWASASHMKQRQWFGLPGDGRSADDKHLRINSGLYKNESRSHLVEWLPPENEEGNTEYKLRLGNPAVGRFEQLVTQMQFRLAEGSGLAFYYVGVEDNGYPRGLEPLELDQSVATAMRMASELDASVSVDRLLEAPHGRLAARLAVRRLATDDAPYTDVRVVVLGASCSGKSTLVSVLSHGAGGRPQLDDGRGAARTAVFRHKHEVETGRTSAVSQLSIGYDGDQGVVNYAGVSAATQAEISAQAERMVSLLDVGGHSKFMKTALHALTAMVPDFAMLCIPADTGALELHRSTGRVVAQHLSAAIGLRVPTFFVVTKADSADADGVAEVASQLDSILSRLPRGSHPSSVTVVNTAQQAMDLARQMPGGSQASGPVTAPLFQVSSVSGAGLPELHAFLSLLPENSALAGGAARAEDILDVFDTPDAQPQQEVHFQVGHMFEVENVGSVASGTLLQGSISLGDSLYLGPTESGSFKLCDVTSIQRSQVPVRSISAGQTATVALHPAGVPLPCRHVGKSEAPASWLMAELDSQETLTCKDGASPSGSSHCSSSSLEAHVHAKRTADNDISPGCPSRQGAFGGLEHPPRGLGLPGCSSHQPRLRKWAHVGMVDGQNSPSMPVTSRRGSRGAVLVSCDPEGTAPAGVLEFEAQVALLPGGYWPPRGLVSGRWPPVESLRALTCRSSSSSDSCFSGHGLQDTETVSSAQLARSESSSTSWSCAGWESQSCRPGPVQRPATSRAAAQGSDHSGRAERRRLKLQARKMKFTHVVHCGSARQAANVVYVQEVTQEVLGNAGELADGWGPAKAASQVMGIAYGQREHHVSGGGCLARIRFQFAHHPEWLVKGSSLVIVDRTTGHLTGAGAVVDTMPNHH